MKQKTVFLVILSILVIILAGADSYADSFIREEVPRSTLTEIPTYDGEDYIVLQNDQPDFYIWQIQTAGPARAWPAWGRRRCRPSSEDRSEASAPPAGIRRATTT